MVYRLYGNKIKTFKKRLTSVTAALVLAATSLSSAAPLFFSQKALAAGITTISNLTSQGWNTADTRTGGTVNLMADSTSPLGVGALQLTTDNTTAAKAQFLTNDFVGTSLSSISRLSYATKQNSAASSSGGDATYQIGIDLDGNLATTNDQFNIVYEPYWQNGGNPDAAPVTNGNWQNWDVTSGLFWATKNIGGFTNGAGGPPLYTLATIKSMAPNAVVTSVGTNIGTYNAGYNIEVDNFVFNNTTYNFEPAPPAAPTSLVFQKGSTPTTYTCGSTVNSTFSNQLQLTWTDPSGPITVHRTAVTYPDGTPGHTFYTNSRNLWLDDINGGVNVGFGLHGDGVYTYTVQAQNAAGWGTTTTCALSYDTHIPTATFTQAPNSGASVNSNFHVAGTAQDNVALSSVAFDVRTQDGSTWKSGCVAGTTSLTYSNGQKNAITSCDINTSGLVDGTTYMLRIHASDYAGYGNVNPDAIRYFTIDRTAPEKPTLVAPENNAVVNGASVTQSWSDTSTDVDHYIYESYNNAGATNLRWHEVFSGTSKTATNVGTATYWWRVAAVDHAGNTSAWSDLRKLTIDNTAPVVAITAPSDNGFVRGITTISGTVTDTNPDHYYLVVKNSSNTVVAGPGVVNLATVADYSWSTAALSDGTYTIDLEARDAAGNKDSNSTQTISVEVDNTKPVVTVNPLSTTDTTPTVTGTIKEANLAGTTLTVTVNGHDYTATVGSTMNLDGSYPWSADVTDALPLDTYTVTATATDPAGNVGTGTNELTITTSIVPQATSFVLGAETTTPKKASVPSSNGNVLGAETTTPTESTPTSSDTGKVKGADTTTATLTTNKSDTINHSRFLGLGWWWLAVLAVLLGFFWFLLGKRDERSDK